MNYRVDGDSSAGGHRPPTLVAELVGVGRWTCTLETETLVVDPDACALLECAGSTDDARAGVDDEGPTDEGGPTTDGAASAAGATSGDDAVTTTGMETPASGVPTADESTTDQPSTGPEPGGPATADHPLEVDLESVLERLHPDDRPAVERVLTGVDADEATDATVCRVRTTAGDWRRRRIVATTDPDTSEVAGIVQWLPGESTADRPPTGESNPDRAESEAQTRTAAEPEPGSSSTDASPSQCEDAAESVTRDSRLEGASEADATDTSVCPDEHAALFTEGPVVVFEWRHAEGWPVEYVSPNVTDLCGYTPAELRSGAVAYSELVHEDDLARVSSEVAENSAAGVDTFSHDPYRIVTRDGSVRWVLDYTRIERVDGEVSRYLGYLVDITERKEREVRLDQAESIGNFGSWKWAAADADAGAADADASDDVWWSDEVYDIFGRPPTADPLPPAAFLERIHPDDVDRVREAQRAAFDGEPYDVTYRITVDDETRWIRDRASFTVDADGNPRSATGVLKDITDRKRHERELKTLTTTAQDLLQADSVADIGEIVVSVATDLFEIDAATVHRYDPDLEALVPTAATGVDDPPRFTPGEGAVWEVYVSRTRSQSTSDDSRFPGTITDGPLSDTDVILSLGEHGVLLLAGADESTLDEQSLEIVSLLAATSEAAFDRTARTSSLRARTREATERAAELEYVSELNETIRSLYTALIDADSRGEIHRSVSQALTTIDRVDAAWIGTVDPDRNVVEPAAQAHLPPEYLEDQSFSLAAEKPTPEARVASERTVVDVDRVPVDVHRASWRNTALIYGFRSVVAVPIRHEELFYGTLTVYSTETAALDERTKQLLEEFGTLIGFVTNAVERRDAFGDDQMVDLTVDVEPGDGDVCVAIASRLEATLEIGNVTRRNRNSHVLHCSIDGADPGTVTDVATEIPGLESIRPLSESTGTAYELVVVDACVASRVVPISGLLRSIRVEPTNCQIVFSVPEHRDYQRFLEQVRDVFSTATLVAKRQASVTGPVPVPELLEASLSEKQAEALRTAYHSGYFDDDRKRTGAEIATSLGIAQPTFSNRLRSAQRDLLAAILEPDSV